MLLAVKKDSFIDEMETPLPLDKIFQTLAQNDPITNKITFHWQEQNICWRKALTRQRKNFHHEEYLKKIGGKTTSQKNLFLLTGMQYSLKTTFSLNWKIKVAVPGVSENGRYKWFPLARKSVPSSRNQFIFQNLDFPVSTNNRESLNKRLISPKHMKWWLPLVEKSSLVK